MDHLGREVGDPQVKLHPSMQCPLSRPSYLIRIGVDGHHVVTEGGEANGDPTVTTACVDDPGGPIETEETEDLGGLEVSSLLGQVALMEPVVVGEEPSIEGFHPDIFADWSMTRVRARRWRPAKAGRHRQSG